MGQRHAQACFPWSPTSIPARVKGSANSGPCMGPGCGRPSTDDSGRRTSTTRHRGGPSRRSTDRLEQRVVAPLDVDGVAAEPLSLPREEVELTVLDDGLLGSGCPSIVWGA